MGSLGSKRKAPPKVRVEKAPVPDPARPRLPSRQSRPTTTTTTSLLPSPTGAARPSPAVRSVSSVRTSKSLSQLLSSPSADRLERLPESRKRKAPSTPATKTKARVVPASAAAARRKTSPERTPPRTLFGAESSSSEDDWVESLKKRRRCRFEDAKRRLRSARAFGEDADANAARDAEPFIHAEQVASLALKCEPAIGARDDEVAFELQYPSLLPRERYELVTGKDNIDAVDDALGVVRRVAETYLTDEQARPIANLKTGIIRRLQKASNRNINDVAGFKAALRDYNELVLSLVRSGAVSRNLDRRTELLPPDLVAFVLDQVYDRAVAPTVELLTKYRAGSDNVYGELLHPLVTRILVEEAGLRSDQVFVDLGSGVGNVVIQAALEIGCESWGCEMMENACNLAEAQLREFRARCALWGLQPGRVRLERGDFRKVASIHAALQTADLVLVNNQAFTAQLNDDLVRMFLDLKPGCKIVSLRSFVRSASHSVNDVASTILHVEERTYPEGDQVSWTNAGGTYCISTRK